MEYRYEYLYPRDFLRAVSEMPVFYVPCGLLEWHGDHLPLGLDALKAHGICLRLAGAMQGGIVLPPLYIGRPGYSSYTGTLTYSESLVQGILYETLGQLEKVGAKVAVILTGHYGPAQLTCVKRAAEIYMQERPGMAVIAQAEYEGVEIDGRVPGDHAGIFETSLMQAFDPDRVDMANLMNPPHPPQQYPNPPQYYYAEPAEWKWPPDVTQASAELGERALAAMIAHLKAQVEAALARE